MEHRKGPLLAWCLYDWANSSFPTVITTFVFAAYFTKAVAADVVTGTGQWAMAISLSALAVAVAGPVLGAVADRLGARKPWLGAFTALSAVACAMLWFTRPDPTDVLWALVLVAVANFGFEMGMVFYNAMLPGLAPPSHLGRVSGWGWGLGYMGGLACLGTVLVGLDMGNTEDVRATSVLVAAWFAVFSLPLFLFTPDTPKTGLAPAAAVRLGLGALIDTLRRIREHATIARFLLARMIYTDGLNTLFAFGGIYAAGTFGMDFQELIVFGIGMNVTAGLGAAGFAFADDRFGAKRVILVSLCALSVLGAALLVIESKTLFWVVGMMLGVFVGPAQAASRSLMARLAPPQLRTEMFGLYAFSGKATAFLGPALLGWVTVAADSQRAGMAVVLVFFVVGTILLWSIPDVEPGRRIDDNRRPT